jgi:hypothetical protein
VKSVFLPFRPYSFGPLYGTSQPTPHFKPPICNSAVFPVTLLFFDNFLLLLFLHFNHPSTKEESAGKIIVLLLMKEGTLGFCRNTGLDHFAYSHWKLASFKTYTVGLLPNLILHVLIRKQSHIMIIWVLSLSANLCL